MSEQGKEVNLGLSLSEEYSNQQNDGEREKIWSTLFFSPDHVFHLESFEKPFTKKSIFNNKGLVLAN